MNRLLITDTHFGCRQNSTTWLKSQLRFIDEQIIPYLKSHPNTRIIHLGDVFDSRSSISPMIAKIVRDKFVEISKYTPDFIIIAGNHDFYSPANDDYDTLSMVFRDCNIKLVIKDILVDEEDLYVPWYCFKKDLTNILQQHPRIKNIYTHADIRGEDLHHSSLYRGYNIFSGHIHIPAMDYTSGLYNLGSCYPLNFSDSNNNRYVYTWDGETLNTIKNECSISFWRLHDDEIFSSLHSKEDYYEFYIKQTNLQSQLYQKRIEEISKILHNYTIIPVINNETIECCEYDAYNIEDICKTLIPEHLVDKFEQVLKSTVIN